MPLNVPRKRTFAYESDGENTYNPSGRFQRQRTSSTISTAEPVRAISLAKAIATAAPTTATREVLKPATSGNVVGSLATAPRPAVSIIGKPEPPQPSGIPRSVALKSKLSTRAVTQPKASKPAAPVVVKALKLKEASETRDNGRSVSANAMVSSSSKPDGSERRRASTLKARSASSSTSSKNSLESLLSGRGIKKEPQLERRVPTSHPLVHPKQEEPTKETSPENKAVVTDSNGCAHLSTTDCELLISFVNSPHYEVWDIGDEAHVACPAYLYIMAKDPSRWAGTPLAQPDITLINIECRTKRGPPRFTDKHSELDNWTCRFDGMELPTASGPIAPANVPSGSISIEMKWDRVYWAPPSSETGRGSKGTNTEDAVVINPTPPLKASPSRPANSLSSLLFAGPQVPTGKDGGGRVSEDPKTGAPGRGWCMKFWIPVPARLFLRKETRVFEIDARVHIVPGIDKRIVEVGRDYGFVAAQSQMTVSHLRSEREMVVSP